MCVESSLKHVVFSCNYIGYTLCVVNDKRQILERQRTIKSTTDNTQYRTIQTISYSDVAYCFRVQYVY